MPKRVDEVRFITDWARLRVVPSCDGSPEERKPEAERWGL
jgi:hypothetical protein